LELYFGIYPEGSKLAVFVREPDLPKALKAIEPLFPIQAFDLMSWLNPASAFELRRRKFQPPDKNES
jgi:hypothetical protein